MSLIERYFEFLENQKKELIINYDKLGLRNTGAWERNLTSSVRKNDFGYELKITGLPYTQQMEYGRPPTKQSQGGILKDVIRKWIDTKPIAQWIDKNNKLISKDSMAFLITRKIHNDGTKQFRKGIPSGLVSGVFTPEKFNELNKMTLDIFKIEKTTELIDIYKKI